MASRYGTTVPPSITHWRTTGHGGGSISGSPSMPEALWQSRAIHCTQSVPWAVLPKWLTVYELEACRRPQAATILPGRRRRLAAGGIRAAWLARRATNLAVPAAGATAGRLAGDYPVPSGLRPQPLHFIRGAT